MVRKLEAKGAKVDWKAVNKATEIARTYLVTEIRTGKQFFKMYKPSEAQKIFKQKGWKGSIVSKLERNKKPEPERREKRVYNEVGTVRMSDFGRV